MAHFLKKIEFRALFQDWTVKMTSRWSICLTLLFGSALALAAGERHTRGLADDVGHLFKNVFNTGLDQFQEATMRQVRGSLKCDQICRNFATLAKFETSLVNF